MGFGFAFPKTLKINQPTHKSCGARKFAIKRQTNVLQLNEMEAEPQQQQLPTTLIYIYIDIATCMCVKERGHKYAANLALIKIN